MPVLLDAYFSRAGEADALDWVGLLASCAAFESYCKVYTADLKPDCMAEFLLLNPEFPYSVRYAVERMGAAIAAISQTSFTKATGRIERIAGRLRASLAYVQIGEIMISGVHRYLNDVIEQCNSLHAAVHVVYIDYPIQSASGGLMFYAVRHFTRFRYSLPVWQSAMELRMQPRSENTQRCFTFQLSLNPQARVFSYQDHLGNFVHHFDVPGQHRQLTITADALVEVETPAPLPESLGPSAWDELDAIIDQEDYWDMLMPSRFACTSPEVEMLAREMGVMERGGREPLELLTTLNSKLYQYFSYVKRSTGVDSAVEDAIRSRQGVCQDFAHTMIAMVRNLRIPCRYVSGYLHRDPDMPTAPTMARRTPG